MRMRGVMNSQKSARFADDSKGPLSNSLGIIPGGVRPTLDLSCNRVNSDVAPAGSFTRASTATRMGPTGLIESVANDLVRREWNADGSLAGWLIEESRTNLLTYSENFDNAAWTKYSTTVSANAAAAPDGSTTAEKLTEASDTSKEHSVYYTRSGSNETVTLSAFVKRGERTKVSLVLSNFLNATAKADFDLVSGTVSGVTPYNNVDYSNASATISPYYNGYFRCSITATKGSVNTTNNGLLMLLNDSGLGAYNGDGTSGLYIWGAQLEAGAFPTSYIPTTSSAATRAADVWTVPVSSFAFNKDEGTVYADFTTNVSALVHACSLTDGTTSKYMNIGVISDGSLRSTVFNTTSQASLNLLASSINTPYRVALAYKVDNFSASANGSAAATDTSGTVPTVSQIEIGKTGNIADISSRIRHIAYFPRRITDSNLQLLTA